MVFMEEQYGELLVLSGSHNFFSLQESDSHSFLRTQEEDKINEWIAIRVSECKPTTDC